MLVLAHLRCTRSAPEILPMGSQRHMRASCTPYVHRRGCTWGYTSHHAMRRVMYVQPGAHEVGCRAAYVTLHTGPRGEDSPACSRPTYVRRAEQPRPPTCEARSGKLRFRRMRPGSGHRGIAAPAPLRWARRWHAESLQRRKGVEGGRREVDDDWKRAPTADGNGSETLQACGPGRTYLWNSRAYRRPVWIRTRL